MMTKHYVTAYLPGIMVSEEITKEVKNWHDITDAKDWASKNNAYAFRFTTRYRGDNDLDSREIDKSGLYYLGGTVKNIAQVDKNTVLYENMKCNGWDHVIHTRLGNACPFLEGDQVL